MLVLNGIFSSNTFTDWLLIMLRKILFLFCLGFFLAVVFWRIILLKNILFAEKHMAQYSFTNSIPHWGREKVLLLFSFPTTASTGITAIPTLKPYNNFACFWIHINRIIHYELFCVWLLLSHVMFARFILILYNWHLYILFAE